MVDSCRRGFFSDLNKSIPQFKREEDSSSPTSLTGVYASGEHEACSGTCEYYVLKAIITADSISNSNECIVIVTDVRDRQMAFTRIGEDEWTFIDTECCRGAIDVLQRGDKLCALEANGDLVTFSITSESYSVMNRFACVLNQMQDKIREYLVLSHENELLMVVRICDWDDPEGVQNRFTLEFLVFKFDFDEHKWIMKTSLGDDVAPFIGENLSIYVVASNFPGCKPNCIYYNHDHDGFYIGDILHDFGMHDMKTKEISKPYSTKLMTIKDDQSTSNLVYANLLSVMNLFCLRLSSVSLIV